MLLRSILRFVSSFLISVSQIDCFNLNCNNYLNPRARLESPSPDVMNGMENLTICASVNIKPVENEFVTILSYSSKEHEESKELLLGLSELHTIVYVGGQMVTLDGAPASDQWSQVCVTLNVYGDVTLYIDDEKLDAQRVPEVVGRPLGGNGELILCQDQYSPYYEEYDSNHGMIGSISQVHVWSRILSDTEILPSFEECKYSKDKHLVNWDDSQWTYLGNIMVKPATDSCGERGCGNTVVDIEECTRPERAPYDLAKDAPELPVGAKVTVTAELVNKDLPSLDQFSICCWVYHGKETKSNFVALKLSHGGGDDDIDLLYKPQATRCLTLFGQQIDCKIPEKGKSVWVHHCFIWSNDGSYVEYYDGELVDETVRDDVRPMDSIPAGDQLVVQQRQYRGLNDVDPSDGYFLKIVDVNIHSDLLSGADVKRLHDCSGSVVASVVNWYDSEYETTKTERTN